MSSRERSNGNGGPRYPQNGGPPARQQSAGPPANTAPTDNPGPPAVVETRETSLKKRLVTELNKGMDRMLAVLPSYLTPAKVTQLVAIMCNKNTDLLDCDPMSIINAIVTAGSLNLDINPGAGESWLIPRKGICCFQPGYRGLIKLMKLGGEVAAARCDLVYKGEIYIREYNPDLLFRHVPDDFGPKTDDDVVLAYCHVALKTGITLIEPMNRGQIETSRHRGKSAYKGPWATDWQAMAKRCPVVPMSKWITMTPKLIQAFDALNEDDEPDTGSGGHVPAPKQLQGPTRGQGAFRERTGGQSTIDALPAPGSRPPDPDPDDRPASPPPPVNRPAPAPTPNPGPPPGPPARPATPPPAPPAPTPPPVVHEPELVDDRPHDNPDTPPWEREGEYMGDGNDYQGDEEADNDPFDEFADPPADPAPAPAPVPAAAAAPQPAAAEPKATPAPPPPPKESGWNLFAQETIQRWQTWYDEAYAAEGLTKDQMGPRSAVIDTFNLIHRFITVAIEDDLIDASGLMKSGANGKQSRDDYKCVEALKSWYDRDPNTLIGLQSKAIHPYALERIETTKQEVAMKAGKAAPRTPTSSSTKPATTANTRGARKAPDDSATQGELLPRR